MKPIRTVTRPQVRPGDRNPIIRPTTKPARGKIEGNSFDSNRGSGSSRNFIRPRPDKTERSRGSSNVVRPVFYPRPDKGNFGRPFGGHRPAHNHYNYYPSYTYNYYPQYFYGPYWGYYPFYRPYYGAGFYYDPFFCNSYSSLYVLSWAFPGYYQQVNLHGGGCARYQFLLGTRWGFFGGSPLTTTNYYYNTSYYDAPPASYDDPEAAFSYASGNAEIVVAEARRISDLLTEYRNGGLVEVAVRARVRESVADIRSAAAKIRDDRFVESVDGGADHTPVYPVAYNLDDLQDLAYELETMAVELRLRVDELKEQGEDRFTVSAADLNRPSIDSLARTIRDLAKVVANSTSHL